MDSKARKFPQFYYISIFTCLIITAALVISIRNFSNETSPYLDIQHSSSATSGFSIQDRNLLLKQTNGKIITGTKKHVRAIKMSATIRRLLSVVRSAPPSCINRCGHCSPCKPVFAPVTPPTSSQDYYPDVWKCKCGNKIYKS